MRFDNVRLFENQQPVQVTRRDGTRVGGKPVGLRPAKFNLGGATVELDIAAIKRIEIRHTEPHREPLQYTLTVRLAGQEIAKQEGTVAILAAASSLPAAMSTTSFQPFSGESRQIDLPDPIADVVVARGGQLVLLYLKNSRKLAVYDVNQVKIVRYLSLAMDDALIAAGQDKLVIISPSAGTIERWSLDTFERETRRTLTLPDPTAAIALGYASQGPLIANNSAKTPGHAPRFIDLQSLAQLDVKIEGSSPRDCRADSLVRASANGRTFTWWATETSPNGINVLRLAGSRGQYAYEHSSASYLAPNFDGSYVMTGNYGTFRSDQIAQGSVRGYCVPTTHPRFFVNLPAPQIPAIRNNAKQNDKTIATIYSVSGQVPVATLPDIELGAPEKLIGWNRSNFTFDKRFVYVVQAGQFLYIPLSNDRLMVRKFDLREALDASGNDYLYVSSLPPSAFRKGEEFSYQLEVVSKPAEFTARLDSGPDGMALSADGKLTWNVPADFADRRIDVIISIENKSGQAVFERFGADQE
ncbi:MAG: hypothetical protein JSS27_20930 [Planctomycetes bacterium]|nr:hypothetical protein [Planctomycetota bacterium]